MAICFHLNKYVSLHLSQNINATHFQFKELHLSIKFFIKKVGMEREHHSSQEMIFGIHPIIETIESGKEIEKVLIQKELKNPSLIELASLCNRHKIPMVRVPIEKINRITKKAHQGVLAFVSAISYASLDNIISVAYEQGKNPFILVLDRITDVRNLGAIVRTAECVGIDAIVIPDKNTARLGSDAFKTSAGALSRVAICRERNLKGTLQYLKNNGLHIIGCTEKSDKIIYEVDYDSPLAIVMGSEEDGISPECLRMCDEQVKIPMYGKIGSLNVSVATGVILYEAVRKRN
jgi:23S rRNA (guanosine2251-2'-O)-methyltransferase